METNIVYGECPRHPGNSMNDCVECELEKHFSKGDNLAPNIKTLLGLLAENGGEIVSTAALPVEFINQARASGRMYVDENGLGYVWTPPIYKLPETEEEVEQFEKWFPLPAQIPDELSTWDKLQQRIKRTDLIKKQKRDN